MHMIKSSFKILKNQFRFFISRIKQMYVVQKNTFAKEDKFSEITVAFFNGLYF